MEGQAPQPARRARGYYGGRWKKAKDAFHRITAISAKENKALLQKEETGEVGVSKCLALIDTLTTTSKVADWEHAVQQYDRALAAYVAMLDNASSFQSTLSLKKETYLAACKTLKNELKALKMEMAKDTALAKASGLQQGSQAKKRATIEAELLRGRAAIKTAKNRIARLKLDKTQIFLVWNGDVKEVALGLAGVAGHFSGVLRTLEVQGIAVPSSIIHSLDVWKTTGVPHANDVHNHPDVAARLVALRELELTMLSLDDWLRDTEVVLNRP